MELREFAERVLFATTLEEKLQGTVIITDARPGPALQTPESPGRPAELRFKLTGTGRGEFPGTRQLEQERERGRLLHFFANHELLATELMALVLLKFPEAPAAFRKGVLQTLKDEQEHTRLYLERMEACGIALGELPVSGYFWRAVSPMENPLDYVSSLCLTFEQANLDFARHFARGFATVGDDPTAKLLERIYHDEIAHVAYGLKWFRRWKNPSESDWEAFCRTLKFPLSPQRAKGFTLNVEGRRAAGFDPQFIAELNVYSQSKGRTPGVFVFNPFAEGRLAEGKAFNPTKHQAQLARDLDNLPQFLCRQDDLVLVERRPSVDFLSGIQQAGFALPEFVALGRHANLRPDAMRATTSKRVGSEAGAPAGLATLSQRKLGSLRPWAWGPDSVALLEPLFGNLTGQGRTAEQFFNQEIARLYSKGWSAELLRKVLTLTRRGDADHLSVPPQASCLRPPESQNLFPPSQGYGATSTSAATTHWLCTEHEVGVTVNSLDEALAAVAEIRGRGHHQVVIKESLGLAGSNAMRLFEPELLEHQRRWIVNALANGRQLVVEPWLERALDFSVQLEMTSGGLKLCGYTGLITNPKGHFRGNWAAPKFERRLPPGVSELFAGPPDIATRLHALYADVFSVLEVELRRVDFHGPIGIDAFVYRQAAGHCRLKPIVEINPRYTMGRLTVELMKHVAPGSHGLFRIVNRAQARAEGFDDFAGYADSLRARFPLQLEGDPVPRIQEGAICLNDPAQAQVCLAVFQVARETAVLGLPKI